MKRVKFGDSGHFLENKRRELPEIWYADVSWPLSELVRLWRLIGAHAYQEGRRCRWAATLSHFWPWSIFHIWPESCIPIHELLENARYVILWTLCGYNMWFCAFFYCGSLGLRPGYSITFPPNPLALITSEVWQTWLWQILLCKYTLSRKVPCH